MTGTSGPVRVVVAEDSVTARHVLVAILGDDQGIEVVGEAANGLEALELTKRLRPDIVLMDITMPIMDGFEATKRIMIEAPTPVLIVTAAADREVELGLRAVQVGALSLVPKPSAPSDPAFLGDATRLVRLIKALSEVTVIRRRSHAPERRGAATDETSAAPDRRVIAIAASTGGPAVLYRLLELLPRSSLLPILVVQHIAEGFSAGLVSWLGSGTKLVVKLAEEGELLSAGTVFVAPEDRHLEVTGDGRAKLRSSARIEGFRPSATALFASVAAHYGSRAVAVVLTGMGRDGLDGAIAVHEAGGQVMAQDEASSVVFGMPGVVVARGIADVVGPVEVLAERLTAIVSRRSS